MYWVHPPNFEEAVDTAFSANFNFKAAQCNTHMHHMATIYPMDPRYAEGEKFCF